MNRWVEADLLDVLEEEGVGCIAFSPLAQGSLTDATSTACRRTRARRRAGSSPATCSPRRTWRTSAALNELAKARGQTLAQMALAWVLRDPRVTSALIGASSVEQLEQNIAPLGELDFSAEELEAIDAHAVEAGINLWEESSSA